MLMKTTYLKSVICLLLAGLFAGSCSDEKDIVVEGPGNLLGNIEFPQGEDAWDQVFVDIYEEYGVRILYKGFTDLDWSKSWTGLSSTEVSGERFETEEELTEAAEYMKKYVFDLLDPELSRGVFRPYIYLIKNMVVGTSTPRLVVGMDSWAFSPPIGEADTESYRFFVWEPKIKVFADILVEAYNNERITLPDAFYDGVDYETAIFSYNLAKSNNDWANLWTTRGFFYAVAPRDGFPIFPRDVPNNRPELSSLKDKSVTEFEDFLKNILVIREIDLYFEDGCHFEQSPLLLNRVHVFKEHLKEVYGIDLESVQRLMYEGFTGEVSWKTTFE